MLHWQKKTTVLPSCNFEPPVNSLANPPSRNPPPSMKKPCCQQLLLTPRASITVFRTDQSQVGPPDVHTHVHQISAGLASTFAAVYEKPPPKPRKTTMRPATWELVTLKRTTRNTLSALQQQQRWNLLRTCFTAWVLHQSYDGSFRVYGAASSQAFLACCQTFASTTQTEAIQSNSYVLAALG